MNIQDFDLGGGEEGGRRQESYDGSSALCAFSLRPKPGVCVLHVPFCAL